MRSILAVLGLLAAAASRGDDHATWTHYGGSEKGLQYSSLRQIDRSNVATLREAWRYRTGELGHGSPDGFAFQANPILIRGRLYLSTGSAIVIALDPVSGQELWRHDPGLERAQGYSEVANRGVSAWTDGDADPDARCAQRIFAVTLDARIVALDAASGERCTGFGKGGEIFLNRDVRANPDDGDYTITSPPVVINDVLITGSAIGDNGAVESELGIVRGIDPRSGSEIWRWDPIPREPDDPAISDWLPGQAARNASASAWAPLAADSALGLVYVPTGSASPDFFGGERLGNNAYADSLVALRAADGTVAWHRQLVHHDLWDYDLAAQPTLVELERDGQTIPAVLQGTKTGLIFTFDRRNGAPLWPIEERPAPQGAVPGEVLSPTQTFPVAPPPLSRHDALDADDAWGLLWFDRRACAKKIGALRSGGIFTPPSIEGTLLFPGYAGGINWGGLAFHPDRQLAVAFSMDLAMEVALIPREQLVTTYESGDYEGYEFARQTGTPYGMRRKALLSPLGVPCTKPPWGVLSAVDMKEGRILWQVPAGTIEDIAPAIVPNLELGVPGSGGPIVTGGGLVFLAATMDDYLRAFDIDTGEKLWEGRLPAGGQATPMTYYLDSTGKQYVVIAAGGHPNMGTTPGDHVVAFALPD